MASTSPRRSGRQIFAARATIKRSERQIFETTPAASEIWRSDLRGYARASDGFGAASNGFRHKVSNGFDVALKIWASDLRANGNRKKVGAPDLRDDAGSSKS
jgi:hypothetical protein